MKVCMVLYVNMPPQLPWPGQALRANRARTSSSWSATWKADTRSMRPPVSGSTPGLMGPSERMTAGVLFSSTAATVPTGGLSQATTATSPATLLAARWTSAMSWTSSRPTRENRICGVPLSWPSETPRVKAGGINRTGRSSAAMRRWSAAWTAWTFCGTPR